jgi:hypothetical protein
MLEQASTFGSVDWGERLAAYRRVGDPDVDDAIETYRSTNPAVPDLRALVRDVIDDLPRVKEQGDWCPRPLSEFAWQPPPLPEWAHNHEMIERGQDVFNDRGLEMGAALVFAALPMGYAAVHGAEALSRTSDFATRHLTRRVAETGQMLIDVMGTRGPDSLEPGGSGHATAVGLRLLHGCVRALLTEGPHDWQTDDLGVPLNQEIMLATLMDFTVVTWEAMERIGVDLPAEDRRAHLYTWSVIGAVMGLDACQNGPLDLDDASHIAAALHTQLESTDRGRLLMAALLRELERMMPLGLRKLPCSMVRWLFADAPERVRTVPDMLGVPPSAWWSGPAFTLFRETNEAPLPGLLQRPVDRLRRRAGRLVFTAFADGWATEAPPFRIPPELQRSWHIRTGKASVGVRSARRSARLGVRATGHRLAQRSPTRSGR